MTGKDGNAFCREVRSDPALAGTVMIASSASVYEGDRQAAESAGFDGFLPKPVKEQDLFEILGQHLDIKWILGHHSGEAGSPASRNIPIEAEDVLMTGRDLPVEELRQLLILAGDGDVVALRRSLQELAEANPAHARFADQLAGLVSAYRIDEVETLLQQLTCDSSDGLSSVALAKEEASAKSEVPVAK
jgi:CheY-like chemotaxis protein